MDKPSSVLLLIDVSTVLASKTRDWEGFSTVGAGVVPQVVMEQLEFLCDRAPDQAQEMTAREFRRFFPHSGWELVQTDAEHPSLQLPSSGMMSQALRLLLATARAAYGLALERPNQLTIVLSNDHNLRRRIEQLRQVNLSTLPVANLLQWVRTKQRPLEITQQLQAMIKEGRMVEGLLTSSAKTSGPAPDSPLPRSGMAASPHLPSKTNHKPPNPYRKVKSSRPSLLQQFISAGIALLGFTTVGIVLWSVLHPKSFNPFWKQIGLPALPTQRR